MPVDRGMSGLRMQRLKQRPTRPRETVGFRLGPHLVRILRQHLVPSQVVKQKKKPQSQRRSKLTRSTDWEKSWPNQKLSRVRHQHPLSNYRRLDLPPQNRPQSGPPPTLNRLQPPSH